MESTPPYCLYTVATLNFACRGKANYSVIKEERGTGAVFIDGRMEELSPEEIGKPKLGKYESPKPLEALGFLFNSIELVLNVLSGLVYEDSLKIHQIMTDSRSFVPQRERDVMDTKVCSTC